MYLESDFRGDPLQMQKKKIDSGISSDRIIVESWTGRSVSLWGLMFKKLRWSKNKYDDLFVVFMAITNYPIASPNQIE